MNKLTAESHVRLAARMYEMRETARQLLGESYALRVSEWVVMIGTVQKRHGIDVLPAILHMQKLAAAAGKELSDMDLLLMTAAAVEMSETDRMLEQIPAMGGK